MTCSTVCINSIHIYIYIYMQTNMYVFMYGLTDGCIDECMYDVSMYLNIHVASRRQPPAPHRWAHTNMMMKRHVGH